MKLKTTIISILTSLALLASSAAASSLSIPNIDTSFKAWMDYRAITNTSSAQYALLKNWCWVDYAGFVRCNGERDLGITDDYYAIALGSYYGTQIGTKYKITLNTGKTFYGILTDQKANSDTDSSNRYTTSGTPNMIEFLVNSKTWNGYLPNSEKYTIPSIMRRMGSANAYPPLNGSVTAIERLEF